MAADEVGGLRVAADWGASDTIGPEFSELTSIPSRLASAMLSQVMDCGAFCFA
jgi:hypothetical protein